MERKRIILRTWLVSAIVVLASVFPNRRGPFWNKPGVIGAARAECKRLGSGEVKSISYADPGGHPWAFPFRSKVSIYTHLPPAVFVRLLGKVLLSAWMEIPIFITPSSRMVITHRNQMPTL